MFMNLKRTFDIFRNDYEIPNFFIEMELGEFLTFLKRVENYQKIMLDF